MVTYTVVINLTVKADSVEQAQAIGRDYFRRCNRWIPVTERLPGDEWIQAAVYRASDGEIDFAHWDSTEERFDSYIGDIGPDVTHWLPLPLPPSAQEQAGVAAQPSPRIEPVHLIFFADSERRPEIFAGAGATAAAHQRFDAISASWNADLFVKIKSNNRNDLYGTFNDNGSIELGEAVVQGEQE